MKKMMLGLLLVGAMNSSYAQNPMCEDSGLLEVVKPQARSLNQIDYRIADDTENVFLRLGDRIYVLKSDDGELKATTLFDQNSVNASELKKICKKFECDSGLKEILKDYRVLKLSSKTEKAGLATLRLSDNVQNIFVKLGDRVYSFVDGGNEDFQQADIFGKNSWEVIKINEECRKQTSVPN